MKKAIPFLQALGRGLARVLMWLPRQLAGIVRRALTASNDPVAITFFGFVLVAVGVALITAIVELWPAVQKASASSTSSQAVHFLFGLFTIKITSDTSLLVLVIVVAAIGAYVHAATSFADYVGNKRFVASWTWWYALRLFIGISLALLLYFAVRGGFISASSNSTNVNPYGIAALAGLAGLFSKQATDKLREVFETMFHVSKGDAQRKDDLTNPKPAITATEPDHLQPGQQQALTVIGNGFTPSTGVMVGATTVHTAFDHATHHLSLIIPAPLAVGDSLSLTAVNPPPDGGSSVPYVVPVRP